MSSSPDAGITFGMIISEGDGNQPWSWNEDVNEQYESFDEFVEDLVEKDGSPFVVLWAGSIDWIERITIIGIRDLTSQSYDCVADINMADLLSKQWEAERAAAFAAKGLGFTFKGEWLIFARYV